MWQRSYSIPTLAMGLGTTLGGCFDKPADTDEDITDVPLLGRDDVDADGTGDTGGGGDPDDPVGSAGLLGQWALMEVDGVAVSYGASYTYGPCTYTYSVTYTLDFDRETEDGFAGLFVYARGFEVTGEDCEIYYGGYSYGSESTVTAVTRDTLRYDIQFESLGFVMDCTQDADELNRLDCNFYGQTFLWER